MRVLLDSTVLIDALRGRDAQRRINELEHSRDTPCTTGVNVEEVVRGLKPREFDRARLLFEGLEIIPIGATEGWLAGDWRRSFAGRGVTLLQADCLIGAAARVAGARLATGNPRHFPMPEIHVELWPVGE